LIVWAREEDDDAMSVAIGSDGGEMSQLHLSVYTC